jgi:hypothetical protein
LPERAPLAPSRPWPDIRSSNSNREEQQKSRPFPGAASGGGAQMSDYYEQRARGKEERARVIRKLLAG